MTVTIGEVNDAPSINSASTISVAENQTMVTTISIADPDSGDVLTLSLIGADAESFDLSTDNVLTFITPPDFETKSSYSITLSLTDGTETVTKDITVTVTNVNDVLPLWDNGSGGTIPDGYLMTRDFDENDSEAIGFLRAYDDIENDAISYSFSGNDASYFKSLIVDAEAGIVQISFISPPDYETKDAYDVSLIASDGVNTISLVVELVINLSLIHI